MFVWMMVILKIPIAMLLWLVWWAVQEPEPREEEPARALGDPLPEPDHPRPSRPRPPRRGPHGQPRPGAPDRVRVRRAGPVRPRPLR
jgi:hypothetical protein